MGNVGGRRARARASAVKRARVCAGVGERVLGALAASVILVPAITMLVPATPAVALPAYPLYYSFQIPLALPGMTLQEAGPRTTYAGTLRGTLGGISLRSATFTYGPGASKAVGGGTFRLETPAGDVRNGQILMTSDGERTTLLFFGIYLGSRIEFTLTSDRQQIGGAGVEATGLARTGFATHEAYREAVRKGLDALPSSARDEILAQADANLRLVAEFDQKPSSP